MFVSPFGNEVREEECVALSFIMDYNVVFLTQKTKIWRTLEHTDTHKRRHIRVQTIPSNKQSHHNNNPKFDSSS